MRRTRDRNNLTQAKAYRRRLKLTENPETQAHKRALALSAASQALEKNNRTLADSALYRAKNQGRNQVCARP